MTELTLALDIGGTKIAAGLVDPDGTLVASQQLPTPDGNAEAIWDVVAELIARTTAGTPVRGVGIASAGPIHLPDGTVSPVNITAWQRFPIQERVAGQLPGVSVRLGGDGLCMALGEQWRGAGRGAGFLLGMVVSTGVGGGRRCQELAAAAAGGDDVALQAFPWRAGDRGMIASVAAVCDLDLVVIGGGVSKSGALLFDPLREALARYARLDFIAALQVLPARLGGDAGLIGAAALLR
ncbi:hypothetical protein BH09ACT8_BH09ACT8_67090 [soil metagenome]